ncbi:MAG: hypothetical protein V4632_08860 [Pseudomonadota bacterium]
MSHDKFPGLESLQINADIGAGFSGSAVLNNTKKPGQYMQDPFDGMGGHPCSTDTDLVHEANIK